MVIISSQPLFSCSACDSLSFPAVSDLGIGIFVVLCLGIFRHFFFSMGQSVGEELQHAVKA